MLAESTGCDWLGVGKHQETTNRGNGPMPQQVSPIPPYIMHPINGHLQATLVLFTILEELSPPNERLNPGIVSSQGDDTTACLLFLLKCLLFLISQGGKGGQRPPPPSGMSLNPKNAMLIPKISLDPQHTSPNRYRAGLYIKVP